MHDVKVEMYALNCWDCHLLYLTSHRVCTIKTKEGADYRTLPEPLRAKQFQLHSAGSATGQAGFKPGAVLYQVMKVLTRLGYYGRVDMDGLFETTVTKPEPAGTKHRVIHPTVTCLH